MIERYTNTALTTARRCLREYDLRYERRLEVAGDEREVLQVGHTWHKAFDYEHIAGVAAAGFDAITEHAPSRLWAEKLRRMFAAYAWYWQEQPLELEASEEVFEVEIAGVKFTGQIDGRPVIDGRRGILERKTTSDGVDAESSYWDRLRLDVQVGLYALAVHPRPSFILYDVVRKPTINPKRLTKADVARLRSDLSKHGQGNYYQELFGPDVLEPALEEGRESVELYGARLTADIGDRPAYYFARRPVERTSADYEALQEDLLRQVNLLEHASEVGFPRNPDACNVFGRCAFFGLCSRNAYPDGDDVPEGFRQREHLHPELA